jgi:isopenicillin N synthase-like dioxygenase
MDLLIEEVDLGPDVPYPPVSWILGKHMSDVAGELVDAGRGISFRRGVSDRIPVIDFGLMWSPRSEDRRAIAYEVRRACMEVGFFYLRNHGIPVPVIKRAHAAMQRFFALPRSEKMKIHYLATSNHRGYVAEGDIKADHELKGGDMHEAVELAQDLPENDPDYLRGIKFYGPNVWPDAPPDFRWALGTYFDTQLAFGRVMLRAFALALDLPETFFEPIYTKPMSRLRACYYPPQQPGWDVRNIGIGAHQDYEMFTTVWQTNHAGLQVLGTDNNWIEVTPIEGTMVVNLGDLMQRWSNDRFLSRPHRVVNLTTEPRYSIVQFFGVDHDAAMDAFPTCADPDNPPRYPMISCGQNTEELVAKTYYGA